MAVMMNKLRVGIILPDPLAPAWIARMLEQIRDSFHTEVTALAFADEAKEKDDFAGRLFKLHALLDRHTYRPRSDPWERKDIRGILQNTQILGASLNERIARLKALRLDVLLNLGLNDTLPESLLEVARFGVWSLRCNETRVTVRTKIGWREILRGESLMHCAVDVQRDESVQVVAESVMAVHPYSVSINQTSFLWRASDVVPRAFRQLYVLGEKDFFAKAKSVKQADPISRPTIMQSFSLAWKQAKRTFVNKIWRRWFPHRWTIMAGVGMGGEAFDWGRLKPMILPRGAFWADPFLFEREGKTYIFFEEYIYKNKLGRISFVEVEKGDPVSRPKVVVERPYHLSYPFIFGYRGEFYMIPETAQNRTIEVYRCTRVPDQWEFHATLMKNVHAVDTTLIEHSMRWWMFVNIAEHGGPTWDELHLFYADNPLSNNWTPHPMNPIVSDVRLARPAGRLFRRDGGLIRPSQDSSLRYGHALNLNRVTCLTTSEYEEELVERIEPPQGGKILAVHTYNHSGSLLVLDALLKR
jgi:hypothetical protein